MRVLKQHTTILLVSLACIAILATQGQKLLSAWWSNVGTVQLVSQCVAVDHIRCGTPSQLAAAQKTFVAALARNPDNVTAQRSLSMLTALGGDVNVAEPVYQISDLQNSLSKVRFEPNQETDTVPDTVADNLVIIESFTTIAGWQACAWCDNVTGLTAKFEADGTILEMIYPNTIDERDHFTFRYELSPELPIRDQDTLVLRVKGTVHSRLSIELIIDEQRFQPLAYHAGTGEWEIIELPVSGDYLREIQMSASEPEPSDATVELHQFQVDWMGLR